MSNPQDTCTYHRSQRYFFPAVITDEMKFIPFIKLDKSAYSLGEVVRFWFGGIVSDDLKGDYPKDDYPKDDCYPQHTEITNPLGKKEVVAHGVHPDAGSECGGFLAGNGLFLQDIMVGKYSIVFDVKGLKTQPAIITIQDSNSFQDLDVRFTFKGPNRVKVRAPLVVEFSIKNKLKTRIRFPEFGTESTLISMGVAEGDQDPSLFFYPILNLLDPKYKGKSFFVGAEDFTWHMLERIPSIVLQSNKEYKIQLPLNGVYDFSRPGKYQISLDMMFQFLAGESEGRSDPIRLPISWKQDVEIVE